MKIENVSLGFGQKPKQQEGAKTPNVFVCSLASFSLGATGGLVARNYVPVSDEFFSHSESSSKKQETSDAVNDFIENYSMIEIDDSRVLKTVLTKKDITEQQPRIQGKGIDNLLKEPAIKPVTEADTVEMQNAVKALHSQLLQEIGDSKKNKVLPEKFEALSSTASQNLEKAKQGLLIREHLKKYKNEIKGLSPSGQKSISEVKDSIDRSSVENVETRKELKRAFVDMVRVTQKTQRPIETWMMVPAIFFGLLGMIGAVNYRMKKENPITKKEPLKS